MECPECRVEIGRAKYCGCGWKMQKRMKDEPRPFVQCAHMACNTSATVYLKMPTGWANLCIPHYEQHFTDKAHATCEKLGLQTVSQKRAWVKDAIAKLSRKWTPDYQREPGEDWGEPQS